MRGLIAGLLYSYLWYASILAGYAVLFCPLLPVLLISNRLYRYLTDLFFTCWQLYPTALLQKLCHCNFEVTGDPIYTEETSILLVNHRTRTDWNFFWPALYHSTIGRGKLSHSTKLVLKNGIRLIPGAGWVMQMSLFIYVKRKWQEDKDTLQKYINYITDIRYKHNILLFPEGTDLTEKTKMESDIYAINHNKEKYKYVLHPKPTGFVHLSHQLLKNGNLDAVYDVTLIYPDRVPQNELYLLTGRYPKQIKIHLARYSKEILPRTEEGLKIFLEQRWQEKENTIREFYDTGNFPPGNTLRCEGDWKIYAALVFWTVLPYITLYYLIFSTWFRNLVLAHTALLLATNIVLEGFHNFEMALHRWKKKTIF
ncbi:unnamed protein product [Acanthoscelides obtectus]|nr:unnamed protein product [Acanthoscelides obtectus]CAK1662665.1 Lysocardiolipin acyltransferase 1 [Acanthoscelides obtectus]